MTDNKEFQIALDQFHEYLTGILRVYQRAVPVLKEELEAIMQDQMDVLDHSLKSQQALLLKTRNFDQQTADYLSRLNIKAKNLTEMAKQLPDDEQLRFFGLLGEFELTMTEVNYYKDKCRVLLQSKLYAIDKVLSKQDLPKDNTTYNHNAAEVQGTLFPKSFEKKI
jgi:glutaredoxin 2